MPNLHRVSGHPRAWIAGGSALVVVVLGLVLWRVGGLGGSQPARAADPGGSQGGSTTTTGPPPPLTVSTLTPANSASGVAGTATIQVSFSSALALTSPQPTLSPAVPGSWQRRSPTTLVFTPSVPFVPGSQVSVSIPGGPTGIHAADGATMASSTVDRFQVQAGSELRVQQLLALLDYLPLSWTPGAPTTTAAGAGTTTTAAGSGTTTTVAGSGTTTAGAGTTTTVAGSGTTTTLASSGVPAQGQALEPAATDAAGQGAAAFSPPTGTFAWRQAGWPASLTSLWQPGTDNLVTKGAVMAFEADQGLSPDGVVGPAVWQALFKALASNQANTGGYNYAVGSKTPPESLTIWHDGTQVFHSLANTGISQAPTVDGTFPVYERLRNQVMRGTNPDGSSYADPVQYVAYFNGGDAVHYIPRANYGTPASLGCIELPLAAAAQAWPYLSYGTLVTVTG